jgi:hypothetical protein
MRTDVLGEPSTIGTAEPRFSTVRAQRPSLPIAVYVVICLILDAELMLAFRGASLFGDATSWWTINLAHLYDQATQSLMGGGAFRYSPAFAVIVEPLRLLPWSVYLVALTAIQIATAVWMGGRRSALLILIFPGVVLELIDGNIQLLMATAIVAGFRWPAAWAFLLLTKVTPGVGVLWFAFRREWRSFGIAIGATLAIVAVSFAMTPALWSQWIGALVTQAGLPNPTFWPPLWLRLPLAVALLWWGARTDRRWVVPVAALVAMPTIWANSFALLAGSIALRPARDPAGGVGG